MSIVIWFIYAAVALAAIIFMGLREFHMLQLNGYKTPEHSWWMKKNYKRYIFPCILFLVQFIALPFSPLKWGTVEIMSDEPVPNGDYTMAGYEMINSNKIISTFIFSSICATRSNSFIAASSLDSILYK